jgi:hypothetical protein
MSCYSCDMLVVVLCCVVVWIIGIALILALFHGASNPRDDGDLHP